MRTVSLVLILSFLFLFLINRVSFSLETDNSERLVTLNELLQLFPDEYQYRQPIFDKLNALCSAYPLVCRRFQYVSPDEFYLVMDDGEKILFDDHKKKSFDELLNRPDVEDMLSQVYAAGPITNDYRENHDPGRFRVEAVFRTVYGRNANETRKHLQPVDFCGQKIMFSGKNGAADALNRVAGGISRLLKRQPGLKKYVFPLGGTFNWRTIAGTERLSPHSWGVAIDLNTGYGSYWRWTKDRTPEKVIRLRKNYPYDLIKIFEENSFIWGGKWSHFDLMHFEYRPEFDYYIKRINSLSNVKNSIDYNLKK